MTTDNHKSPRPAPEQRFRDETQSADLRWERAQPMYEYLTYRFDDFGNRGASPANLGRLADIEKDRRLQLPMLTEDHLHALADVALTYARRQYGNFTTSPFTPTPTEMVALRKLLQCFRRNTVCRQALQDQLEPSDDGVPRKWLLGPHVPDLVLPGIRPVGTTIKFSGLIIEVNGGVHAEKLAKDTLLRNHAEEIGLFVYDVENADALRGDKLARHIRLALKHGDLEFVYDHHQTNRLRQELMLLAIATWLTHDDIDAEIEAQNPYFRFNSEAGFNGMVDHPSCPRSLKIALARARKADEEADNLGRPKAHRQHASNQKPTFTVRTIRRTITPSIIHL